jgi:5-methylcytosine-specific restriction endonuclease McrA
MNTQKNKTIKECRNCNTIPECKLYVSHSSKALCSTCLEKLKRGWMNEHDTPSNRFKLRNLTCDEFEYLYSLTPAGHCHDCGVLMTNVERSSDPKVYNSPTALSIDHKRPRFAKGSNSIDNLRLICRSCNSKQWADKKIRKQYLDSNKDTLD